MELILLVGTVLLSAVSVGGGLYEATVIDPAWPSNPRLIQPALGGIHRAKFWIPAHMAYEAGLVASLIFTWSRWEVRLWLLAAFTLHAVMRGWSFAYFIPKALDFEKRPPNDITVAQARAWTAMSSLRIPFSMMSAIAATMALISFLTT